MYREWSGMGWNDKYEQGGQGSRRSRKEGPEQMQGPGSLSVGIGRRAKS